MTVRVHHLGFGCRFFSVLEAVSICSVRGDPYNFTIDLTGESVFDFLLLYQDDMKLQKNPRCIASRVIELRGRPELSSCSQA